MTAMEERRLKTLLKDALTEVLEERQDILRAAVQESWKTPPCSAPSSPAKNPGPSAAPKFSSVSPVPREDRLPRIF